MDQVELAVIGGSGLYDMTDLKEIEERTVDTPFGPPSDVVTIGRLHGRRIAFLPRHGRGHVHMPSEVPYRANIYALKSLGVKYIISVNACGSLREAYAPGHIVVPAQLYDQTKGLRAHTFFGASLVAHISVADPLAEPMRAAIATAVSAVGGTVHTGGTLIIIEGPRFSTKGESHTYRQWGMDVIGMTAIPEAFLAAEAEIAYACMAHVTDYDVWHESEEPVTVEMVIRTLMRNTKIAQDAITYMVKQMDTWAGEYPVHSGLKDALITQRDKIKPETKQKLGLLIEKYIP